MFWPKGFSFFAAAITPLGCFFSAVEAALWLSLFFFFMRAYLHTEKCQSGGKVRINHLLSPICSLTRVIHQVYLEEADAPMLASLQVSLLNSCWGAGMVPRR